jgi:MoxR-like ATPase
LDLVRAFRPEDATACERVKQLVEWGPGPRAAQALMLMVRARALLNGRLAPSPQDVMSLAPAVLVHRMALKFSARANGENIESLIQEIVTDRLASDVAA